MPLQMHHMSRVPRYWLKTSKIMQVWSGDLIFGTFCLISQDPVHIFQNRFLRWNRELKPVDLSTINPKNKTIFFLSYKGGCRFLKLRTPQLKPIKTENDIDFLETYRYNHKDYYQPIWKCIFFNFQPALVLKPCIHLSCLGIMSTNSVYLYNFND